MTTILAFPKFVTRRVEPTETPSPLSFWREPTFVGVAAHLAARATLDALSNAVRRVRPLSHALCSALDSQETSAAVGAVLGAQRGVPDSIATDLLASALLLEGLGGDPTARAAVDHLRRQRRLETLDWRTLTARVQRACTQEADNPEREAEAPAGQP
jgi:hypothetical protein